MKFSDPDEQYVFDERLAILIDGMRPPTEIEITIALTDVERFRNAIAAEKSV